MKITSTLPDFPVPFLRKMISWICKEIDLPVRYIRLATFAKSRKSYGGLAYCQRARIGVRIGDASRYPTRTFKHRYGLQETLADRTEALVKVTAHELLHHYFWRAHVYGRNGRRGSSERMTDTEALKVLNKFRECRVELLARWSVAEEAKPTVSAVGRRAAKARQLLARWQRKLKLAKTKVASYTKRVKYYDKKNL